MERKTYFILAIVLVLASAYFVDTRYAHAAVSQQTVPVEVRYGFVQDAQDPQRLIAVAYPTVNSDDATISTATFAFLLPAGTATEPAIPVAPANGSFVNITGVWTAIKITPSLYMSIGFDAADLEGYDLYQLVLSPGSATPALRAEQPLQLFSFSLPDDCSGAAVQLLTNGSDIQQALLKNLSANLNNQMSISVDNRPAIDLYVGNNPTGASFVCPLGASEANRFFLPLIRK